MESKPVCKGRASVPLGTMEVGSPTAKPRVSCSLPTQGASVRCGCCFTARKPSFQGREIFHFIFLANCSGTPQWKIRNVIHHKCSLNLSLSHESNVMRKAFKLYLVFPFKNYSFPGFCLFFWFILLVGFEEMEGRWTVKGVTMTGPLASCKQPKKVACILVTWPGPRALFSTLPVQDLVLLAHHTWMQKLSCCEKPNWHVTLNTHIDMTSLFSLQ